MIRISPRVVGTVLLSLMFVSVLIILFMISPVVVITTIVAGLVFGLTIFLIDEDRWPWER